MSRRCRVMSAAGNFHVALLLVLLSTTTSRAQLPVPPERVAPSIARESRPASPQQVHATSTSSASPPSFARIASSSSFPTGTATEANKINAASYRDAVTTSPPRAPPPMRLPNVAAVSTHPPHEHHASTALLVSLLTGQPARLIVEAARLLSSYDFSCTIILVGSPSQLPVHLPRTKPGLTVHVVPLTSTSVSLNDKEIPEEEMAFKACEALVNFKPFLEKLRTNPPRLLIFPGLWHDACLLNAFSAHHSAALVLSPDPITAAWLGHATGSVPFLPHYAPLQPNPSQSMSERFSAARQWGAFLSHLQVTYWRPTASMVANRFGREVLEVEEAYENHVALMLSASHQLLERPVPALPTRVTLGCFYCRHAHKLPEDLREWVAARRGGLVIITLPVKPAFEELLETAARTLPTLGFIWLVPQQELEVSKNEAVTAPANIVRHFGLHEQDALGHARSKVVVSSCSEQDVLAATYHGVPLLCVSPSTSAEKPWLNRQALEKALQLEVALEAQAPLDREQVINHLKVLTTNASFRHASRHLGVMMRDEPETSADRLVFWAGHVVRHWGHGHDETLRSARSNFPREPLRALLEPVALVLGIFVGVVLTVACGGLGRLVRDAWNRRKVRRPSRVKDE